MGLLDRLLGRKATTVGTLGTRTPDVDRSLIRQDNWQNQMTGLGTNRDKGTYGWFYQTQRLMDPDLTALFHHNAIARRVVELKPKSAFRRGYDVSLKEDPSKTDEIENLKKKAQSLKFDSFLMEAAIWGALFGGALLILGVDDGQDPQEPVNEKNIRDIKYITLVDRRFVWPHAYYADPLDANYGEPEVYRITNVVGSINAVSLVHESRCIRFDGARTDLLERRMLAGWTYSVLQAPYEELRTFAQTYSAIGHLTQDASQAVFTMKGLYDALSANQAQLTTRMQLIDMSRSVARAVVVDSEGEKFERQTTSFAGLSDLLDRFMMLLSAATEIPVTLLMGRSAAGMNSTGDSDFRQFYDVVAQDQRDVYGPKVARFYRLIALAKSTNVRLPDPEFDVNWLPLWQPTDAEQAAMELQHAQKDQIYIENGVLTPDEVAACRYGTGQWSAHTSIDMKEHQKAVQEFQQMSVEHQGNLAEAQRPEPGLGDQTQAGEPNQPAVPAPTPGEGKSVQVHVHT